MRAITCWALAASMLASPALAAGDIAPTPAAAAGDPAQATTGPLAPGKPAGVKQADIERGGVLLVGGILLPAGGIALLASDTQGHHQTSTTATH